MANETTWAAHQAMTPAELRAAASGVKIIGRGRVAVMREYSSIIAAIIQHRAVALDAGSRPDYGMACECNEAMRRAHDCRERARRFFDA